MNDAGFVFLLTGPSGTGKSSLLRPLLEESSRLGFSVSCTTRPQRPGEEDGRDYHFLDRMAFEAQREAGEFVEWAEVHGNLYGTRQAELEAMLAAGRIPVLDVDVQGGLALLDHPSLGEQVVSVFLFPPSFEELERRLRARGTETADSLERRLANARREVGFADRYRYWVVNAGLEEARADLRAILRAEGLVGGRRGAPPVG